MNISRNLNNNKIKIKYKKNRIKYCKVKLTNNNLISLKSM
jgi:hypothetical protein